MSVEREAAVAQLLREAGLSWSLAGDAVSATRMIAQLDAASAEYSRRFGGPPTDLLAVCRASPDETRALLQSLTAGVSPPFLAMIARILVRGAEVLSVQFSFRARTDLLLRVEIGDSAAGRQAFESTELWDASVLRHFGLLKAGGQPVIDGYYAMRTPS